MTGQAVRKLTQLFDKKDNISQRDAARKYNCSQQNTSKVLKKNNIVPRRKQRAPSYTPDQIQTVKSQCRWMCNQYRGKLFVLDDESYFGLSRSHVPVNSVFYTSDVSSTPADVKYKFKQKFEAKVMLYIVISERGISKP